MANEKKQSSVTVLAYEIDSASIRKTLRSVDGLEKAIADALDVLGEYSPTSKAASDALMRDFAALDRRLDAHQQTVDQIAQEYRDLARVEESLADSAWLDMLRDETDAATNASTAYEQLARSKNAAADIAIGAGSGGGGALDTLDRAAGQGAQILSGLGVGSAAGAVGLIGDTIGAISSFGPIAGVATAAGGAFALIMQEVNRQFEEAQAGADAYLARQEQINALISGGATSGDIQAQIDANNRDVEQLAQRRSDLLRLQQELSAAQADVAATQDAMLNPLTRYDEQGNQILQDSEAALQAYLDAQGVEAEVIGRLTESSQGNITSMLGLNAALEGNQTSIDELIKNNAALAGSLTTSGVAANNARAAIEALESARDRQIGAELAAGQEAESLTAEQRAQRIAGLQAELDAVTVASQAEGISAEYKAQLAEQTEQLNTRIRVLSSDIYTAADAADKAAKAEAALADMRQWMSDETEQLFTAQQREIEAKEAALKAGAELLKGEQDHAAAIDQLNAAANAKREEFEANAADQRLKLETDTARRIADIIKKTNAAISNSIAARDVLAYLSAKQAAKDQTEEAQDAYKEREKDLRDSLRRQLADQDKANRDAITKENQRWDAERAIRQRATEQTKIDVQNAQNAVLAIQRTAGLQALALMELQATGQTSAYQRMASDQAFYLQYMVNRSAAAWAAMEAAMASTGSLGGGGGRATPTPFADGGFVTKTGLALVHEGERIYTPPVMSYPPAGRQPLQSNYATTNNMGGVTIQINGATPAQIRKEVDNKLYDYFVRSGLID